MLPQRWLDFKVVKGKLNYCLVLCARCAETPPMPQGVAVADWMIRLYTIAQTADWCRFEWKMY